MNDALLSGWLRGLYGLKIRIRNRFHQTERKRAVGDAMAGVGAIRNHLRTGFGDCILLQQRSSQLGHRIELAFVELTKACDIYCAAAARAIVVTVAAALLVENRTEAFSVREGVIESLLAKIEAIELFRRQTL